MTQPNTPLANPTPAQRFRQSPDSISKHRDMVDSTTYQRSIDFGIEQYAINLSQQVQDGNSAMAVGFKLQGAIEIILTMRNLSETPPQPKLVTVPKLDHNA